MAWVLEIHMIDVGQGDCTLIIAKDDAAGLKKTMLIDGGDQQGGNDADIYMSEQAKLTQLDHIVCTHYDIDHRGGLQKLLLADNLSTIARALALAAMRNLDLANGVPAKQIAVVTATVCSMAMGNRGDLASVAREAAQAAANATPSGARTSTATTTGVMKANDKDASGEARKRVLIAVQSKREAVAVAAGLIIADPTKNDVQKAAGIADAVFYNLKTGVVKGTFFQTRGRYRRTNVIDIGPDGQDPMWDPTIAGFIRLSQRTIFALETQRTRSSLPRLGSEVLWDGNPPAGAPRAFVVSMAGLAWQGIGREPWLIKSDGNSSSIGLLILFNDFAYCTLGDLGSGGEDAVINAVRTMGLPDPGTRAPLPVPDRIAAVKISHHGAGGSTSQHYLDTASPCAALISAGENNHHKHPAEETLQRLQNAPSIVEYYMTNCRFETSMVPGSMGRLQLGTLGNKSRVAGDNNTGSSESHVDFGDIVLTVTQDGSKRTNGNARSFTVRYWEMENTPPGYRTAPINF